MSAMKVATVRHGRVSIDIGRFKHGEGQIYKFAYRDASGARQFESSMTLDGIKEKARVRAAELALNKAATFEVTAGDFQELSAAKRELDGTGTPLLAALQEWKRAKDLTGAHMLEACQLWADQRPKLIRIKVADAVEAFIKDATANGTKAERVYRSKLNFWVKHLPDVYIDSLTINQVKAARAKATDNGTKNDMVKRLTTLLKWCVVHNHYPRYSPLPVEGVAKAKETRNTEIFTPEEFRSVLKFIRAEHPHYLAAVVLAGFCGIRADEIHGKRSDKGIPRSVMPRQLWSDIFYKAEDPSSRRVFVTIAKEGTPSRRPVPILPVAQEWLRLCDEMRDRDDPNVCIAGAMERVRALCKKKGLVMPENAFRHSYISYVLVLPRELGGAGEDKSLVASWAGNSVQVIDQRYRVLVDPALAKAWFAIRPE